MARQQSNTPCFYSIVKVINIFFNHCFLLTIILLERWDLMLDINIPKWRSSLWWQFFLNDFGYIMCHLANYCLFLHQFVNCKPNNVMCYKASLNQPYNCDYNEMQDRNYDFYCKTMQGMNWNLNCVLGTFKSVNASF